MLISKTGKEINYFLGSIISEEAYFGFVETDEIEFYVARRGTVYDLETEGTLIVSEPINSSLPRWKQKADILRSYWNDSRIPEDIQEEIKKHYNCAYATSNNKL